MTAQPASEDCDTNQDGIFLLIIVYRPGLIDIHFVTVLVLCQYTLRIFYLFIHLLSEHTYPRSTTVDARVKKLIGTEVPLTQ